MRTVFVTSYTPTLDSGRARRTYGLSRALAAHGPVDLVYGDFGGDAVDPAYDGISGLSLHRVQRPGRARRLPAYLRARRAGIPKSFARGIWPNLGGRAVEILGPDESALVIADGPTAAAGMLSLAARRPVVYSAHNLESAFRHRLGEYAVPQAALERFERLLLGSFAESWMVSQCDLAGAAEMAPGARLRLVPNVVDVAAIVPVAPGRGARNLLFLADFSYPPNREGVEFLLDVAMGPIWDRDQSVHLILAGKGSKQVAAPDPRVERRGFVENLASLYAECGCAAVPLLEGGGSPLKFVEALAYGVPIVATPRAAAGLAVEAGRDYLEAAPEGPAFADAVIAALDPARGEQLGREARRLAEAEYSIESLEEKVVP